MTATARYYPDMPPALDGESDAEYTDRLTGADRTDRVPYDHRRNRQCSIGYHSECSDRGGSGQCECPHHEEVRNADWIVSEWNRKSPVGAAVTLPASPDEPPTVTTGPAFIEEDEAGNGWPVVSLEGFPLPVRLSWVVAS